MKAVLSAAGGLMPMNWMVCVPAATVKFDVWYEGCNVVLDGA